MKRSIARLQSFGSEERMISKRLRSSVFLFRFITLFILVTAMAAALLIVFFIFRSLTHINENREYDTTYPMDRPPSSEKENKLVETSEEKLEKTAFHSLISRRSSIAKIEYPNELITFVDEKQRDIYDLDYSFSHPLQNKCRFPILQSDQSDSVRSFDHKVGAYCLMTDERTLVEQVHTGEILVGRLFKDNRKAEFTCYARDIEDANENKQFELPHNERVFVEMDEFVVECRNNKQRIAVEKRYDIFNSVFRDVFTNVPYKRWLKPERIEETKQFSINVLVLDNVSRNGFFRYAPETLKFMREKGFQILHGYNERTTNNADDFDITIRRLMTIMKDRNCATMWNDDRIESYDKKEKLKIADYFYQNYYQRVHEDMNTTQHCHYGHLLIQRFVDMWERFSLRYSKRCHFSFNFLSELTEEKESNLEVIDQSLFTALMRMDYHEALENTITIVIGGQTFDTSESFLQQVERLMPLFAIYFPPKFAHLYPSSLRNFVENKNRLVTGADIQKTLFELIGLKDIDGTQGISLFNTISKDRTCSDAQIPSVDCICQEPVEDDVIPSDVKSKLNSQLNSDVVEVLRQLGCISKVEVHPATYFAAYRLNDNHISSQIRDDITKFMDIELKARAQVEFLRHHDGEPTSEKDELVLKARATYSSTDGYLRFTTKPYIESMNSNCDQIVLDDLCTCFSDY
ncbi:hypothetical protein M3Y96_00606500 [Aphelenchoides besseyi]|nr:hypothetical protein M3Y96_00606500 [Aphelenchoides besseyi]